MNTELPNNEEEFYIRNTLSEMLKKAREHYGLDIDSLSHELKLQKSFLLSLENGEYRDLPSEPYTKAFLITLSKRLKLNSSEIIRQFNEEKRQSEHLPASGTIDSGELRKAPFKKFPLILAAILTLVLIISLVTLRKKRTIPANLISSDTDNSTEVISNQGDHEPGEPSMEDGPVETLRESGEKTLIKTTVAEPVEKKPAQKPELTEKMRQPDQKSPHKNTNNQERSLIILKCVADSVWVTVERKGKKAVNRLLQRNKIWKVLHSDTIFIKSGVISAVEYTIGNSISVPTQTRITVFDGKIIN